MAKKNKRGIAVNKGSTNNTPVILQSTQLDVRQILRQPLDLGKWRNAIRSAESIMVPRRVLLYDLYWDIMLDAHVNAVMAKRIDAVTTAKWQFVDKDEKPVDEVNELLDSLGMADLLKEIMLSIFWGYTMAECEIFKDEDGRWEMLVNQYNRKHMRPEKGIITYDQNGDLGFSIREGRYAYTVLEAGKPRDMGLLISAAQYAILKRNNISDWANFIEIFGQPIMDAEWNGYDEDQRLKLLAALTAMGNSGKLVRPAGTKVNFLQQQGTATGQLQSTFKDAMNAEISKALLGSTETTEASKSSGYAQSKEHGEQDDKKNETDLDFVRRVLNSRFIKIMRAFGLPVDGGKFIIPKQKADVPIKDAIGIYDIMANKLGMPIDHDFVYNESGMPKPADYDAQMAKKAEIEAQAQKNAETDDEDSADTPTPSAKKKNEKPKDKGTKPGKVKLSLGSKATLMLADFFGWPRA